MSYLDKLLQGVEVEWKTLGDICEIFGGLTGKSKADFENGNAKYVPYKNIFYNIEVDFDKLEKVRVLSSENQYEVKYGDVLFTASSEIAEEAGMSSSVTAKSDEKVYLNSFSFGLRFNSDVEIVPEFSKYLFRSHFMRKAIAKTASGVTRFNISKERFKKLQNPIPPLSVQKEIVRILDSFTELTTELTAELTARKKQYNYYREKLLSFEERDVEWKPLGEVCDFQNGFAFQSNLFKDSGLPIVRITNINGVNVDLSDVKYFSPDDYNSGNPLNYAIVKGDILIAMSGATTGKIGYYNLDEKAYLNQRVGKFIPNKELLNNRFLFHFLLTKNEFLYVLAGGGAQPNLSSNAIKEKLLIPIPPLSEQERIVAILDKFDVLTTSISEGLPREIELRKKQYEYYRDLLLTFPKNNI